MTLFVAESIDQPAPRKLFTILGAEYRVTPWSWMNLPLMMSIGIVLALLFAPSGPVTWQVLVGLGYGLLIILASFLHGVGHVVSSRLVEYVDIYPTLCDLAGLPLPQHLHGKSIRPLLVDVDASHKDAVFTRHGGGDAVRTDRYRYMEMRSSGGSGKLRGVGLFDLEEDAQENQNVAEDPARTEVRQRLQAMLDAVRAESGS